ncbi:MerR family transcriptional regulator [Bacillus rubiinfantis]|uniref:MerR family transcriptional regulator n=1 Tax=Bacillus rubiinfantis TaxID=1499680 RepID=UPI0005A76AB3|nr:MerR family transcriptional regulator [Bacillus rubiinfantis]
MRTYTLKEVAKKINVAPGIIRQWEKELSDLLHIPRLKQGARIFTNKEVEDLLFIKEMHLQKLSKEMIRNHLRNRLTSEVVSNTSSEQEMISAGISEVEQVKYEVVDVDQVVTHQKNTDTQVIDPIIEAVDTFKQHLINEVKEEICQVVRKEFIEEVKKEISKGALTTVKSISDSIYKSTEKTKAEIQELSETVEKVSEKATDKIRKLEDNVRTISVGTDNKISTLSKQFEATSKELADTIDHTNNELSSLTETISLDREFFVEERQQYLHEIRQREVAFQQMLTNFREVAATKEKKWWKFWIS